jgi:hypothetical protein
MKTLAYSLIAASLFLSCLFEPAEGRLFSIRAAQAAYVTNQQRKLTKQSIISHGV